MNCNIDTTPDFALELKQLAKRYPSIRDDKSDQESISNKELRQLMKKNGLE